MADVVETYAGARDELVTRIANEERHGARLGAVRLVLFAVATLCWWNALRPATVDLTWAAPAVAATMVFVVAVVLSRRSRARLEYARDLLTVATEGVARVRRDWEALPLRPWDVPAITQGEEFARRSAPRDDTLPLPPLVATAPSHPYAADLDLFGRGSLSQLFPPLSRAPGRTTLGGWLLAPAPVAVIQERQAAIRELIPHTALRNDLAVQAMSVAIEPDRLAALEEWSRAKPAPGTWQRLRVMAVVIGGATWALIAAQMAGLVERPLWLYTAAIALVVSGMQARRLVRESAHADGHLSTLRAYAAMIARLQSETFASGLLQQAQRDLTRGQYPALGSIRTLANLVEAAEARRAPLAYFVLNALLLWDVHVLAGLARWQETRGDDIGPWLRGIGTVEALSALATLAHDHPHWVFPDVIDDPSGRVEVQALGHPLLPSGTGVRNDVDVGPRGTLLVISGSNMSGKSTLLRSIGVNVVLAQAGSVVCAAAMRCAPLAVHTSIRIEDSLQRGVSHFMAELLRIKHIVDAAAAAGDGRPVLYLLDEVLHGTNSVERAIATQRIMAHLMALGAVGVVTTHDLALFDAPSLAGPVRHAHFSEHFATTERGREMRFDYVLRPGKATSRNALALLELVGLPNAIVPSDTAH